MDETFTLKTGKTMPVDDVPPRKSLATFKTHAIPAYMAKFLGFPYSRNPIYCKFMKGWKKRADADMHHHVLRFGEMLTSARYLPGNIDHPSELQIKE